MIAAAIPARVSGLDDLSEWIASVAARGADRFELWSKVRGVEQQRAHLATQTEPFEIADELLTNVERDPRAETGHASYAVFAYRGKEKAPIERAFVTTSSTALVAVGPYAASPSGLASGAGDPSAGLSLALTSMLTMLQQMHQGVFATLQRENANQRGFNESLVRASSGHFDALGKSYERAFTDMRERLDAALREASKHRASQRSAEDDLATFVGKYKEIVELKSSDAAEVERRTKVNAFAIDQFKVIVPVLLAKIAGVPIDGEAIGGAAAGQLLDSLTDAQKATILGALGPEQKIALYEMFNARAQKAPNAKSNSAPAPTSKTDASVPSAMPSPPTAAATAPGPASSVVDSFTPDEEHAFERITQWIQSPHDQSRYEVWLQRKIAREQAPEAARAPKAPVAPANDTNGAGMPAKS